MSNTATTTNESNTIEITQWRVWAGVVRFGRARTWLHNILWRWNRKYLRDRFQMFNAVVNCRWLTHTELWKTWKAEPPKYKLAA